ncbi:MAG: PKD domain-containing protein [Bacteroidetes bacterium]|nr:PKD domain-containing protein [Bacteroidota bacterium]
MKIRIIILSLLLASVSITQAQFFCQAGFTYSIGQNGTVTFTNTSSSNFLNAQYLWSFGDGGTDTTTNPIHIYNGTGPMCAVLP